MLSVVSTYPANQQADLPIDLELEIEFDKPVAQSYLSSQYFRIFVLPGFTGIIGTTMRKEGNKVILTPTDNLPINTDFEVFVAGDTNTADATLQGIQSETGSEVMENNYTFRFTTGELQEIDLVTDGDVNANGVPDILEDQSVTPILSVEVVDTDPRDNAYHVLCSGHADALTTIDVYFDQAVKLGDHPEGHTSGDMISIHTIQLDDMEGYTPPLENHGIPYDRDDITITYHPDYGDKKVLRFDVSGDFRCNSDIVVTLDKNFVEVSGSDTAYTMADDYQFEFRTLLSPMLTTARAVKAELRHSISNISDKIIDEYILQVSLDVIHEYYSGVVTTAALTDRWTKKLVTCMVVKKLITSVTGGYVGVVRQRTLGDLSITYDMGVIREVAADVNECIYRSEAHLKAADAAIGVKSTNSLHYPDRRRDMFLAGY
jgi:hypothetical protein